MRVLQIKKLIHSILKMNDLSWKLIRFTMILSCSMVFGALVGLFMSGDLNPETYHIYLMAKELASIPAGLLLIAGIGTIMLEDKSRH